MSFDSIRKNVVTTKKIYDKQNEYPVDCEFTLPDYCPDIERILKCNIVSRVANLSVLSDTAQVDINTVICILYVTKEDKLFGYEMPLSISKSINVGTIENDAIKSYSTKTEYVNCRAINNRKIDVHGSVSVALRLLVADEKNYIETIDDESIVLKQQNEKVMRPVGFGNKQANVGDDITISNASGSVCNIIRSDAWIFVNDCKTISNKAVVKLTLNYEILYLSSDFRYECIKNSVLINQVIDIAGADENSVCNVNADLCSISFKTLTNADGEMRTISMNAKVNISAVAYSFNDICIVTDGYSVKYESALEKESISLKKYIGKIDETISAGECINLSSEISEIIDLKCSPLNSFCKSENGFTYICGDMAVCISLIDENGSCKYYEKVISYSEKILQKECESNCEFDLNITPINCTYNIASTNSVDFKCELNVNGLISEPLTINAVNEILIDTDKEKNFDDMPSIVAYFGEKGESVWDIALKYNTSADAIYEANDIKDDVLQSDKMLLIPCI